MDTNDHELTTLEMLEAARGKVSAVMARWRHQIAKMELAVLRGEIGPDEAVAGLARLGQRQEVMLRCSQMMKMAVAWARAGANVVGVADTVAQVEALLDEQERAEG
ncbi:MAG: hypothetical protein HQ592_18565 [Planctomycetes bacterium]|nr:hypothetical protein [Planctomycetota bacterium]